MGEPNDNGAPTWQDQLHEQTYGTGEPPPEVEPPVEGAFDPGEHTVDDVLAYVDAHPDQRPAVLAAEQAGKDRTTLVSQLEG